jgi:hypothetical protein
VLVLRPTVRRAARQPVDISVQCAKVQPALLGRALDWAEKLDTCILKLGRGFAHVIHQELRHWSRGEVLVLGVGESENLELR